MTDGQRSVFQSQEVQWIALHFIPVILAAVILRLSTGTSREAGAVAAQFILPIGTAVVQALWLGRSGVSVPRWIIATVAGMLLGGVVALFMLMTLDGVGLEALGSTVGVTLAGAMVGLAQSAAGRVRLAGRRWTLRCAVGWLVGALIWTGLQRWGSYPVVAVVRALVPDSPGHNEISLMAVCLLTSACFTATALSPRSLAGVAMRGVDGF
jgi:hypothetical protein